MSLLELKDVTVSFPFPHGRPPLLALDGLTLSVEQGELVALVGPSGCGMFAFPGNRRSKRLN